jgi:hypothetical protein
VNIMTTPKKSHTTAAHHASHVAEVTAPDPTPAATATTPTAASTVVTQAYLPPPPANAVIPVPPSGTSSPNGANYTAFLPRSTEEAALVNAVADLRKCTNFSTLFGATALPYAQVLQAFDVGNQWTTMRNQTAAWDAYCQTQEGMCWQTIRAMMDRLRPAFDLAVTGDATIASTMPGLATLLGARKAIAAKAVATKKANKAAIARGEAPTHGKVGKRRLKAAQKALLPAAKAAVSAPPPTASTQAAPATPSPASAPTPIGAPQASVAAVNGTAAH